MDQPLSPPSDSYSPYLPSATEPWDIRRVNHLLRRAALGPSPARVQTMLALSPSAAVDSLLDFKVDEDPFNSVLEQLDDMITFQKADDVQQWWYHRMLLTPRPTQERIALFWHNHFATSAAKVDQAKLMQGQIELFRRKGLGSFRELLLAVTQDPAMLIWLDGRESRKGHPNENYGREVMELFTLGIGHYTEKDVQELARAFTGWTIQGGKGVLDPKLHDDGPKTIFGKTDKFDTASGIDLLLSQPAASTFIARKMLREFVNPNPTQEQIDHYGAALVKADWQIKPVFHEMLTSRLFYSDWAYRSRIKSPVELAVGGVLALGGKASTDFVRQSAGKMGQTVLYPPNVKGWDGNEAWINSNTVLLRFNFGLRLAVARQNEFVKRPDIDQTVSNLKDQSPEAIVDYFANLLTDGKLPAEDRAKLIEFMSHSQNNTRPAPAAYAKEAGNVKVRDLIHMIMSTPEYQLA